MTINEFLEMPGVDWGLAGVIVLLTLIFARPLISFVIDRFVKRITKLTKIALDDDLIEVLRRPLYWLVVFIGFNFAVNQVRDAQRYVSFSLEDLYFVLYFGVAFIVVWRTVSVVANWYSRHGIGSADTKVDTQMLPFLRKIASGAVLIAGGIIIFEHFDIDASGLIATLGVGSLAFALAAQDALSDSISGLMIMLDRPFRIGDRIEIQELGTWGDVMDIGLRSSRILTRDHRMIVIPNSIIAKSLVVNYAYPNSNYRVRTEVGVSYGVDLEKARQVIIDSVKGVEGVSQTKPVQALFLSFGDSALNFQVRWWLENYDDTRLNIDGVNSAIYNGLNNAGIGIPFPQQDVHHYFHDDFPNKLGKMLES